MESNSEEQARQNVAKASPALGLGRTFIVKDFKEHYRNWKSPAMYTHMGGYTFCIGMDVINHRDMYVRREYIDVYVCAMPGLYDSQLKWPVKATLTLELINQQGGENATCTTSNTWKRPSEEYVQLNKRFERIESDKSAFQLAVSSGGRPHLIFLKLSEVAKYLINDTLHFLTYVSHLEMF